MDVNPYESPRHEMAPDEKNPGDKSWLRSKPWWGYFVAPIISAFVGGGILINFTSDIDDAGGLQMLVCGCLGLLIYVLLFPIESRRPTQ